MMFSEFIMKGMLNPQFLNKQVHEKQEKNSLVSFLKSLRSRSSIPLHDFAKLIQGSEFIIRRVDKHELLRRCVKYSSNIPVSVKQDVFFFVDIMSKMPIVREVVEEILYENNEHDKGELARRPYITSDIFVGALVDWQEFIFSKDDNYLSMRFKLIQFFWSQQIWK